ncbi:MAG: shikimate kinase [Clostridia bacterium]|nr:shikimate kinase [Clostridia bacterium]
MNIVLTGFMASGKTEISKAVEQMSAYKRLDTDDMIAEEAKMTINEIFAKYGEEYFRKLEHEIIKKASDEDNAVIATGGGTVLNRNNISELRKNGVIINLSPDFSVIKERVEDAAATRPLLQNQSIDEIRERFEKRREFYDNCDYKIRVVSGRTPKSYAMEILKIMDDISNKKI